MIGIKNLYQFKDLLFNLTKNELKLKYKNSVIGFLWSFLHPILLLIVYTFAFKLIIRIKIENFPVYVFTGLLPWMFISGSILLCANSIVNNQNLVKKVYFPRLIIPLSVVMSNFVSMVINFVVLFAGLVFFDLDFKWSMLFIPLVLIPIFFFTLGLGLIFSSLTVKYRDISHLTEILFMVWFYLTPIIYQASMIPQPYKDYIMANPVTLFLEMFRSVILDGSLPSSQIYWSSFLYGVIFLLIGLFVFKKREGLLAEEL